MKSIDRLIRGYFDFQAKYFGEDTHVFHTLAQKQNPKTLVIACSDSRVDPAIVLNSEPGELFVIRNVANLVPPFEMGGGFHGVSSAIEFAVLDLKVESIIVMGHERCGGIHALVNGTHEQKNSFIGSWVRIAKKAQVEVFNELGPNADRAVLCQACEKAAIKVSLENLRTFPFVSNAIIQNRLQILGWYIEIESGKLSEYDPIMNIFKPVARPV